MRESCTIKEVDTTHTLRVPCKIKIVSAEPELYHLMS